jgi:putative component of membrane protein insertase Oxa1/YidC/SpoIIIJ protein YidD
MEWWRHYPTSHHIGTEERMGQIRALKRVIGTRMNSVVITATCRFSPTCEHLYEPNSELSPTEHGFGKCARLIVIITRKPCQN